MTDTSRRLTLRRRSALPGAPGDDTTAARAQWARV
jgi:hypothetical protein